MTTTQQDLFVKTALHYWETTLNRASALFEGYTDDELLKEVAAGKNRVIYLLGHLAAVHDRMLPLLGLGDRLYPHLDEAFLTNPDNPGSVLPPVQELRSNWNRINQQLTQRLRGLNGDEWVEKHTAVSDDDFVKEPHRNRLSVVLSRTGHMSYHLGQLALIKK